MLKVLSPTPQHHRKRPVEGRDCVSTEQELRPGDPVERIRALLTSRIGITTGIGILESSGEAIARSMFVCGGVAATLLQCPSDTRIYCR